MNLLAIVTAWIDGRIQVFGTAFADRVVERMQLDEVGTMFGEWLLGLNAHLNRIGDDHEQA